MSDDINTHDAAQSLQRMSQGAAAQLVWTMAKVLVTVFITGTIAIATGYVRDMRDDIKVVALKADAQDKAQAVTDIKVNALQRVSDSTVLTLQAIGTQVSENKYNVQAVLEAQKDAIHRTRPEQ